MAPLIQEKIWGNPDDECAVQSAGISLLARR